MKLLTKTTLYFLAAIIPLLVVAGFYLFNQFSNEINNRSDKELINHEAEWIDYIESETENGTSFILKTPDISIYPTDADVTVNPIINDIYGTNGTSKIPYRQLSQVVSVSDVSYQIIIRQSQEQKAALKTDVTRIMLFVFAGLFAATIIFNWVISKKLWKPFKNSLSKIRNAELQKMEAVHFETSNTQEFNELNSSLNFMVDKIYKDYINMKEFTENAAHEMQTPIAVVQSKMELLLQDTNLHNEQVQSILQATSVLNRLSKLNQGLLLLAKIENNQYETTNELSLTGVTKKYLDLFDEFIKEKQLIITTNFENDFLVKLHPFLADSLIINLLGNAIKYNYDYGKIEISVSKNQYYISNTSTLKPISIEKLFKRLNTSKENEESSNGLGLAIVKKIIEVSNLNITYHAENGMHSFNISRYKLIE